MPESDPDSTDGPELTGRNDVIRFLERADVPLPDGLTLEKIKSRGKWWDIGDDSFGFRMERHPSPMFPGTAASGRGLPTPARWHVRTHYRFDLTTHEWGVTELDREFEYDALLLVDAEFDRPWKGPVWEEAIERVKAADDPEAVVADQMDSTEEFYRGIFSEVPEDQLQGMLALLEGEFRRRAGLD